LNTVAQIVFACVVLGTVGFGYSFPTLTTVLMALVATLTLLSVAAYVAEWVRHINSTASKSLVHTRHPGAVEILIPRTLSRPRRKPTLDRSVVERRVLFWLAVLVLVVLALWLLSEILLPFVAGLAIAYLLTPLTDRLERLGVNRLAAAFIIIAVVVLALVYLILLGAPILR